MIVGNAGIVAKVCPHLIIHGEVLASDAEGTQESVRGVNFMILVTIMSVENRKQIEWSIRKNQIFVTTLSLKRRVGIYLPYPQEMH